MKCCANSSERYPRRNPPALSFFSLIVLLLTACSSSASIAPPSEPAVQPQAGSRPPVIRRVIDRQEVVNGYLFYSQDIYFTDPDGDAVAVTYEITSSSLTYPLKFPDTPIETSAEEQKNDALFVETTACWQKMELTYESRILDQAGNLSEPVLMAMSCQTPPPLDTKPLLIAGFVMAVPIGLVLLLVFWLLFRKDPAERLSALRSMLLLFVLLMFLKFLQFLFHEGGHALVLLAQGVPVTLYIHPFLFSGFARPVIPNASIWSDIMGTATTIPIGLLISLPLWKRRSLALLPLVMILPYIALLDGFNLMGIMGDFRNVVQSTGLPAVLFLIPGAVILCIGLLSLLALLPLAGLDPRKRTALFILPAALFLISFLSFLVAHLFVPGSTIDREYFMGREILAGANSFLLTFILGIVLALLYITLFHKLYPRLPAWLHCEVVTVRWKDLMIPAALWLVSVLIGLILIR